MTRTRKTQNVFLTCSLLAVTAFGVGCTQQSESKGFEQQDDQIFSGQAFATFEIVLKEGANKDQCLNDMANSGILFPEGEGAGRVQLVKTPTIDGKILNEFMDDCIESVLTGEDDSSEVEQIPTVWNVGLANPGDFNDLIDCIADLLAAGFQIDMASTKHRFLSVRTQDASPRSKAALQAFECTTYVEQDRPVSTQPVFIQN